MHVKSYKNVHRASANVKQGMKSDSVFGDCFDTKVKAALAVNLVFFPSCPTLMFMNNKQYAYVTVFSVVSFVWNAINNVQM